MRLFYSTVIYILVFLFCIFLFKLSEQEFKNCTLNNKKISKFSSKKFKGYFYAFLAITIICVFAAIRAEDVGVDTKGYPIKFMKLAKDSGSYSALIKTESDLSNEPMGALLVYFCSLFTEKSCLLLFFYQFLTIVPIFLAALQFKDDLSITDAMIVYIFVFFNNSLNMMRQSVGCGFLLLSLTLLIKRKTITKCFLTSLFAILFHRSAIYGVVLIFGVYFSFFLNKKYFKYLIYVSIILVPIILPLIVELVANTTTDSHVLYYLDVFFYGKVKKDWLINPFSIYSLVYIIVSLCYLAMPILFRTNFFNKKNNNNFKDEINIIEYKFASFNLIGFLLYCALLLSLKTMYGIRFSIYYDFIYIISIPLAVNKRKAYSGIMFVALAACWFLWIMRMGWSGSQFYHICI